MASTVGAVQDLVVEHGEVECKTEADGVGRGEFSDSNVRRSLVSLEGLVGAVLSLVSSGEFSKITVVITHPIGAISQMITVYVEEECSHLVVEDLRLARGSRGNEVLLEDIEDVFANLSELALNFLSVALDHSDLGLVSFRLLFLLNR